MSSETEPSAGVSTNSRAITLIASATVLALLYLGREVLVPITLALILGLLIAPAVRWLRRFGLGHAPSVLIAVLALALCLIGLTTVIGSQVVHLARSLPQYEATIHAKVKTVRAMTIGRMEEMQGEVSKVISEPAEQNAVVPPHAQAAQVSPTTGMGAEAVRASGAPMSVLTRILSSVWIPLQTAGIVLVVLIFVLLEHEALRDRFIRLAGGSDLRATTVAINDAGERLSRFFVSTFSVNFGVGVAIWLGLTIIGLPDAPLWATLAAVLRFVPYVGIWLAAILSTVLAAAVVPGWSLMLMTLGLYVVVEIVAAELVEPQLYGHTTGLSPLAVVVAAIFWSWLWGPIGLILSTPLTLCLVVAGRHVKALNLLEIMLGDTPALTLPQRLYQRALSGDADEILAGARLFLKRKSFAAYCDAVLLPAMQIARLDLGRGSINPDQQARVRNTLVRVIGALGSETRKWQLWRRRATVLDSTNLGRHLRQQREDVSGRWQGPLAVAPGSLALCVGLGSMGDDFATEMLTRILRDLGIDARHLALEDFAIYESEPHPDATPDAVSMVYIVSADPAKERDRCAALATNMRQRFPQVHIVAVLLPELMAMPSDAADANPDIDQVANSLEEAAQQAIARFPGDAAGSSTTP